MQGGSFTWFSWRLVLLTVIAFTFSFGVSVSGSARAALPYTWTAPASVDSHAITALACPSTSLCVAVDNAGNVITTADPGTGPWVSTSVAGAAAFTGLSCPSTSLCVAVDQAGNVATSGDPGGGSGRWTLTNVSDHPLSAVSCASVTLCAVTVDAGAISSVAQADAAGTVLVSTNPQVSGSWLPEHADSYLGFECGKYGEWDSCYNAFTGLSCPTTSLCIAADQYGDVVSSTNPVAGALSVWSQNSAVGAGVSGTNAVSCASASLCAGTCVVGLNAVFTPCLGSGYDAGDLVTWNPAASKGGVRFATLSSNRELSGVWCSSTSVCFVAQAGTLLVSSDPTGGDSAWSVSYTDPAPNAAITAVACSTAFCVAGDNAGHASVGTAITTSQFRVRLGRQLAPTGRSARIHALIRHHGYSLRFNPATAGRVRISWYACSSCRAAVAERKAKVATGSRGYSGTTAARIRLSLTRSGRRLLRRSRRLQITAVASFTPSGAHAITASRTFTLRR